MFQHAGTEGENKNLLVNKTKRERRGARQASAEEDSKKRKGGETSGRGEEKIEAGNFVCWGENSSLQAGKNRARKKERGGREGGHPREEGIMHEGKIAARSDGNRVTAHRERAKKTQTGRRKERERVKGKRPQGGRKEWRTSKAYRGLFKLPTRPPLLGGQVPKKTRGGRK